MAIFVKKEFEEALGSIRKTVDELARLIPRTSCDNLVRCFKHRLAKNIDFGARGIRMYCSGLETSKCNFSSAL
jgi:hypothetical protein